MLDKLDPAIMETERLRLRPLQDSDAGLIALYVGDKRVAMNLAVVPHPYPPGAAEAYIKSKQNPENTEIVWVIEKDNELIGVISINPMDDDRGSIGYWLAPQFWGAGYTSEALSAVIGFARNNGFSGLEAGVHQGNESSAKVLIKQGFEYSGDSESHSIVLGGMVASWDYLLELGESEV